jgi:hypothetical protein
MYIYYLYKIDEYFCHLRSYLRTSKAIITWYINNVNRSTFLSKIIQIIGNILNQLKFESVIRDIFYSIKFS